MKLKTYNNPFSTFDAIFGDPFETLAPLFEGYRRPKSEYYLEWFEDDSSYYARLDLPGIQKENLHLEFEPELVTLSISEPVSEEVSERTLRVPEDITPEDACARLENGVLLLTLPKSPEKKPVSIKIS